MKASIIIPNYNGVSLLKENMPLVISAKENPENKILEIIIVDDGSSDESVQFLKQNFPDVILVKHTLNRGFSAAVNTGARQAKGELIVLLNSDVRPQKDFLVAIHKDFEKANVFAVSMHEAGYGWAKGIFSDGFIAHEPGVESMSVHKTFWVSGGSGVYRRDIWMKLGGMDEKLLSPAYWEDLDISYRALKRGYILLWDPNSKVIHQHEGTVSKLSKIYFQRIKERNQLLFIWKNLTSPNLFKKHLSGLAGRVIGNPGYARIVLMAIVKIKEVLSGRRKEKREAKTSDEAILESFAK